MGFGQSHRIMRRMQTRDELQARVRELESALAEIQQRAEYFAASSPRHPQNAQSIAAMARAALAAGGRSPGETEDPIDPIDYLTQEELDS